MTMKWITAFMLVLSNLSACKKSGGSGGSGNAPVTPPNNNNGIVTEYRTAPSGERLSQQAGKYAFNNATNNYPVIEIDSTQKFQTVRGFGFTLTGASAELIMNMSAGARQNLLNNLFSPSANQISFLRLSMGASDLDTQVFSYDDMPMGQTDPSLAQFKLNRDTVYLVPLLQQILQVNPSVKLIATPWSAPAWMKGNGSSIGGSLLPAYYSSYAQYFVRYIKAMAGRGIVIDAVTPQNEPLNPNNNPSLVMPAVEQTSFIRDHLGPALQAAGLSTRIICYDHNCDRPDYPNTVLSDGGAAAYTSGSAFHLYAGDISALSQIHNQFPSKDVYFTEQWTSSTGSFNGDLRWHIRNVLIGSMRNWSVASFEWNLASDPGTSLHTPGGCTTCLGGITINQDNVNYNVGFYVIAHASAFVPPGAVRVASTTYGNIQTVAFKRPDGKLVLIVGNDSDQVQGINVKLGTSWFSPVLPAGGASTFIW